MPTDDYEIQLKGPGISIEQKISHDLAKQIVLQVLGVPDTSKGGGGGSQGQSANKGHHQSDANEELAVREFLLAHEAQRNPEKIASIALYMKTHGGKPHFTKEDLIAQFEAAEEQIPGNLARDINFSVKIGWIAPKNGMDGAYYLTGSGKSAVESKFPAELRAKTKVSKGGRKPKKTGKATTP